LLLLRSLCNGRLAIGCWQYFDNDNCSGGTAAANVSLTICGEKVRTARMLSLHTASFVDFIKFCPVIQ